MTIPSHTLSSIATLALFSGLLYLFYAAGRCIAGRLDAGDTTLCRSVHAAAFGFILLLLGVAVLGALGALRPQWMQLFLIGVAALGAGRILDDFRQARGCFRAAVLFFRERVFYVVIAAVLIAYLVFAAFSLPVAWDEVAYGLFLPKQYVLRNGLPYIEEYGPYSLFPAYGDMPAIAGILLGYDYELPHLFTVATYVLVAMGGTLFAERIGVQRLLLPAVFVMCLALPAAIEFAPVVKNDLLACLFELMSLVSLLDWKKGQRLREMALAGMYAGTALGVKYTALMPVGITGFLALAIVWTNRKTLVRWYVPLGIAGGLACLMFLPWGIRNAVLSGNPVFPLATGLLGGGGSDAFLPIHARIMWEISARMTDWSLGASDSLRPWVKAVALGVGPLPYLNLPIVIWANRARLFEIRYDVTLVIWWAVTVISVWIAAFFWEPRYVLVLHVILVAMVGLTLQSIGGAPLLKRVIVAAVVLSQTLFAFRFMVAQQPNPKDFFRDPDRDWTIKRLVPFGGVAWYLNSNTPPGTRVATNTQPFWYLDRPIVHLHGQSEYGHFQLVSTEGEFLARLRKLGVAYVAWGDRVYEGRNWRDDAYEYKSFMDRISRFVRVLEVTGKLRFLAEVQGVRIYAVEN